jgi:hypothetical protein
VLLIDLDASGWRPAGWDMACLYVHFVLETTNHPAYDAVERACPRSTPNIGVLSLIKATLATTFILTLDPTVLHHRLVAARSAQIRDRVRSSAADTLVGID